MVAKAELVATLFSVADVGLAAVKALRPEGLCEAHVLLVRLALLLHNDLVVLLGVEAPGTVHHGHSVNPPLLQLQFLLWQLIRQFASHLLEYPDIALLPPIMEAMLGMMPWESCTMSSWRDSGVFRVELI